MTRVINIRLKLSDFIDTDLEKTIMDRIKKIPKANNKDYFLNTTLVQVILNEYKDSLKN